MAGALEGYRILDITINVLGPLATQTLGDMGADVIKIEQIAGDDVRNIGPGKHENMSVFFLNINRNKRSISLNLKEEKGREVLRKLIKTADVFVHSVRLKSMEKLGFSYEEVAAINPNIIYACANGFSQSGPYAERPAYDDIIQASSGLGMLNKRLYGIPGYAPMALVDKLVGVMLASSVTTALLHRERTGEGQFVEVPMFEAFTAFNLAEHFYGEVLKPPVAKMGYPRHFYQHRRPFKTKDGYIGLMPNTGKHWFQFFDIIGQPELKEDPRFTDIYQRTVNIETLYSMIDSALPEKTSDEWLDLFMAGDIPCAKVNDLEDLLEEPHLKAIDYFKELEHPTEGTIRTIDIPIKYSKSPGEITRLAPNLGEHTNQLLAELGYLDEDIAEMVKSNAIGVFEPS